MKAEQRVTIRTDPRRRGMDSDGLVEHAAYRRAVDVFASNTESDDAAGEHIDDQKDPMAAEQYRLATKQIHAPEAVLGLCEEGEPGRTRGARMIWVVMRREDSTHDVLINLHGESMRDLLGNALIAKSGVTELNLKDGRNDFRCRVLGAGLAPGSRGREQAPILSIDQRLVES